MKPTDLVIIEQTFKQPVNVVWNAITKCSEMRLWFFDNILDFKPEVGFKTQFNVKAPSRDFLHCWEVVEVVPNHKLVVNWQFEGLEGVANVTMQVTAQEHKTHFKLIDEILEPFDTSIPEFKRESSMEGWNYFIKVQLVNYLGS